MKNALVSVSAGFLLLAATPALACPGPGAESYVIVRSPPTSVPSGSIVLEVRVPEKSGNLPTSHWQTIEAEVLRVVEGDYNGKTIILENGILSSGGRMFSSCWRLGASKGFVVGRLGKAAGGRTALLTDWQKGEPLGH